jgi:hypothetical protein
MNAYLVDWKQLINDAKNASHVEDDQSLQIALDKLAQAYGEIETSSALSLIKRIQC